MIFTVLSDKSLQIFPFWHPYLLFIYSFIEVKLTFKYWKLHHLNVLKILFPKTQRSINIQLFFAANLNKTKKKTTNNKIIVNVIFVCLSNNSSILSADFNFSINLLVQLLEDSARIFYYFHQSNVRKQIETKALTLKIFLNLTKKTKQSPVPAVYIYT